MAYLNFRSLLSSLLLVIALSSACYGQRQLGVQWDNPQNADTAIQELQQFNDVGVSVLQVSPPLHPRVWKKIDSLKLDVYGRLNIKYPLTHSFSDADSATIKKVQQKISGLIAQPSFKAIGLFSYGPIERKSFQSAISPFIKKIKEAADVQVYGILSPGQSLSSHKLPLDFIIRELTVAPNNLEQLSVSPHPLVKGYYYVPSQSLENALLPFRKVVEATAESPDAPLFVQSKWLLSMLEGYPQSKSTFQSFTEPTDTIFPLPDRKLPASESTSAAVMLLLFIWLTVGLHYRESPVYKKSLIRYFTGHKFFINDVEKRHFRTPAPAIILIIQNACALLIGIYISVKTLMTQTGRAAIFHHLPGLSIFGTSAFSFGIWIFIISLIIAFISIFWLSLVGKKLSSPTQLATLYAWPLHFNFLLITLAVALFASGANAFAIIICTGCALLVQIGCFVITALDALNFNRSRQLIYISCTIGIYLSLIIGGLSWGMSNDFLQDVLSLAVTL